MFYAACRREAFIFGGCGGRALREPPKITPLCGATVLGVACGPRSPLDCIFGFWRAVRRRRSECDSSPPQWGGGELRGSEEPQYSHASALPAAEAISGKGRAQRRSVKNRRPFDCFKSAAGIRFSAVARPTPKSFHRGGFWRHLLTSKGGLIDYDANPHLHDGLSFIKQTLRLRLVRVVRAAASPRGGP